MITPDEADEMERFLAEQDIKEELLENYTRVHKIEVEALTEQIEQLHQRELRNKVGMEIENFILFWTSYEGERARMMECLDTFMGEVYED